MLHSVMAGFKFKQFAVEQDDVAMKVGTDGVLLGAWAECEGARRIIDIGTGTGVIALQMAQRNPTAQVQAVEIDETAARRARANFDNSPWAERMQVEQTAVQEFSPAEKFDLIISNPPYFVDSLLPPDAKRSTARHTHDLTFEELDRSVVRLLAENGKFVLILPVTEFEKYLSLTQLHLVRRCDIYPIEGGAVKRVMGEFAKQKPTEISHENIAIERGQRGDYTDEYRDLTKDFYLKF
ncbi:MAG: methyltransferase domain-containing protein [Rikenellaceae bacterium]|nr:methyltransferase domain-containing protein [Rikenellaceae bacterium]